MKLTEHTKICTNFTYFQYEAHTMTGNGSFVTLPDGRRFAIAVFTKSSTTSEEDRSGAVAEVTRSLYDFYYLTAQDK